MGIKDDIKALNRKIDRDYELYLESLKEVNDKKIEIASKCDAEISIINSERHLMREEIKSVYDFLRKFGSLENQITLFDFVSEPLVKKEIELPIPKMDKIIIDEKSLFWDGLINKGRAHYHNKKSYETKSVDIYYEANKQTRHIEKVKDAIAMNDIIFSIVKLYRISITMVRDAVKKVTTEFDLIESFIIADRIKDDIINGDNPYNVKLDKYDIDIYDGSAYNKHYLFVRNVFDYYQFITKVYTEPILENLINGSGVTEEEKQMFESQFSEAETRSEKLMEYMEVEG